MRASPGRTETSMRAWSRRSGRGAAASSCCRPMRRACRWKSRCRRKPCRATRIWNGRWPPAIPRNTPPRAGQAMTATSFASPSGRAMRSIWQASTTCILRPKSSMATIASSASAMTSTGPGRCATPSIAMSTRAAMPRALPETSCGRRGWKTRAAGRSATSTAPAPRIRPTSPAAMSPAPPIPGKLPRSAGPAR